MYSKVIRYSTKLTTILHTIN